MNRLITTLLKFITSCALCFGAVNAYGQSAGSATSPYVCLYSQVNFSGVEYCTTTSTSFVPLRFSALSVRVSPDYQARLFNLPFFLGSPVDVSGDVSDFSVLAEGVRSIRLVPVESSSRDLTATLVPIISLLLEETIDPNDLDGDGFSNEFEVERGTDPNNPADYPDVVKPQLSLTYESTFYTAQANLIITGTAVDPTQPYSGIESITITSTRFAETVFSGTFDASNGSFAIEVPLEYELNKLTVRVTDHSENQTQATLDVIRSTKPIIESLTPENGSVLTEDTFTLRGSIRTRLSQSEFVVRINDSQVVTSATGQADLYEFEFVGVPLSVGQNSFVLNVTSALGGDEQTLLLSYLPDIADQIGPPIINPLQPASGSIVNTPELTVGTSIESLAGPLTVTVNGESVISADQRLTRFNLSQSLTFAAGQTMTTVTVDAQDSLGKTTQRTATYYLDNQGPGLFIDQGFAVSPSIVSVDQPSVRFTGRVIDQNLSSLLVNGQSVRLSPGASPGEYRFEFVLSVTGSEINHVRFVASDRSGNQSFLEYQVRNESTASISAVLPPEDTVLLAKEGFAQVQVVARLTGDSSELNAFVFLESAGPDSAVALNTNGTLASTELSIPDLLESQVLVYELRRSDGSRVTSDSRRVVVQKATEVEPEVLRIEPSNNAQYIEPNTSIEVYFNQAIDLNQLTFTVLETLNGKSYLNADPLGEDFITAQGYVLSDINRNREAVPGQLDILPGGAGVVFSPQRNYGYAANVYVDIAYDGNTLSRSQFKVRALPTFVNGSLADQFGQPLRGIKVSLPELNRVTTTNGDGGFTFGYQESGEQTLPGGTYTLLVNDEFANPRFGTLKTSINLQENRINTLPRYTVQELNNEVPFSNLNSGVVNALLGGDLKVDLSDARAIFPNSRTSGPVHAQFLPYEHAGVQMYEFALPHWLYGLQPKGILVEGDVSLEIKIPMLRGSYDYIDTATYQYVVLVGYSAEGRVVEPIGVGRIEDKTIVSVGKLELRTLDYLGYAVVSPKLNEKLSGYANGQLSIPQLKSILQAQSTGPTN